MPNIYEGDIKLMFISKLELNNNKINRLIGEMTIQENAKFYENFIGKKISFNYDTYLPDRMEAEDYIKNGLLSDVMFVDYNETKFVETVNKKTLKKLKKSLRNK